MNSHQYFRDHSATSRGGIKGATAFLELKNLCGIRNHLKPDPNAAIVADLPSSLNQHPMQTTSPLSLDIDIPAVVPGRCISTFPPFFSSTNKISPN